MSTNTTSARDIEARAADYMTASGADEKLAAFLAAVAPLAAHTYKHGSDADQWRGKAGAGREMRPAWSALIPRTNKAGKLALPNAAKDKAFRVVAELVIKALENRGRDKSDEAVIEFEGLILGAVSGIFAPARAPAVRDEAKAQADKIARAVRAIQDAAVTLESAAVDALRAVIAAHDAMRAASKPTTPTGADLRTAIADAMTAAGIPETV